MRGLKDPKIINLAQQISSQIYKDLRSGKDVDLNKVIINALRNRKDIDYTFVRLLVTAVNEHVTTAIFKDVFDKTFRFRVADVNEVADALGITPPNFDNMYKDITFDYTKPWWLQQLPPEAKKAEGAPSVAPLWYEAWRPRHGVSAEHPIIKTATIQVAAKQLYQLYNNTHDMPRAYAKILAKFGELDYQALNRYLPEGVKVTPEVVKEAIKHLWYMESK